MTEFTCLGQFNFAESVIFRGFAGSIIGVRKICFSEGGSANPITSLALKA